MPRSPAFRVGLLSLAAALATMALKFAAWAMTGSVGLFADAAESSVNLVAAVTALLALAVAARGPDLGHPYGHSKAEYFSSGSEGALILLAAVLIVYSAVERLLRPQPLTQIGPGLSLSLLAAAINFTVARIMLRAAARHDSITLEADARHLLTDVWTSAAVAAGLAVVWVAPRWQPLDPLLAAAVALHIGRTGALLVWRSVQGLMDTALPTAEVGLVVTAIRHCAGARVEFHNLRTRKAGDRRFVEFHLLVPGTTTVQTAHNLCQTIEAEINAALPKSSIMIHVEPREDRQSWDGLAALELRSSQRAAKQRDGL